MSRTRYYPGLTDPFTQALQGRSTRTRTRGQRLGRFGDVNQPALDLLGVPPTNTSVRGPPPSKQGSTGTAQQWTGPNVRQDVTGFTNSTGSPSSADASSGGGKGLLVAGALIAAKLLHFF